MSVFATTLGVITRTTNVGAPKIDYFSLKMYSTVLVGFFSQNSIGRVRFFEEIFFLAETSIQLVFGILFLSFTNVDIKFNTKELTRKKDTVIEAMLKTRLVELFNQQKFVITGL